MQFFELFINFCKDGFVFKRTVLGNLGLGAGTLPVLDRYIEEYKPTDLIFYGEKGNAYSERSVQEVVKSIARKAGVVQKVTPKTLRHSFATHSLGNGIDLRYMQGIMGHASSIITGIYTRITKKGF